MILRSNFRKLKIVDKDEKRTFELRVKVAKSFDLLFKVAKNSFNLMKFDVCKPLAIFKRTKFKKLILT
jgi:hypothetical protein